MQRLSATEIANKVDNGVVTAREIAIYCLKRLEELHQWQPQAFISKITPQDFIAQAEAIDARVKNGEKLPLAGVPFAVKDNIDVLGFATTAACPEFSYEPVANSFVVQRLINAGAICVGKTNLDQFATGLVGVRSPYGIPHCVFNKDFVSGGSSSGSAVAVGFGAVAFALGTDTAGSGRVPAAFNHLIGVKPSKGRYSISGLVPACKSLDCITIFANDIADVTLIDGIAAKYDEVDEYSRAIEAREIGKKIGIPKKEQWQFFGDMQSEFLYQKAINRLKKLGYEIVEIDIGFLLDAAHLLYNGPWVVERTIAIEELLRNNPDAINETVRTIIERGFEVSGLEVFKGQYELQKFIHMAQNMWREIDCLCLPTAPTIYRINELAAAPIALNSNLGYYTNFVNLLDMAAIAVPAGFRSNNTGFGITFIGDAGSDEALLKLADEYIRASEFKIPNIDKGENMETIKLAVVGAHLEGMPLHWQLTSRGAKLVEKTTTAKSYKLYAIANSTPPKPALIYDDAGSEIIVEVYELGVAEFGSFTAEVPPPLAIGSVTLQSGEIVKGFVAEPRALIGAKEITEFGGWARYVENIIE